MSLLNRDGAFVNSVEYIYRESRGENEVAQEL